MRYRHPLTVTLVAMYCQCLSLSVFAEPVRSSYAADGHCYCLDSLPESLARRIVPTPAGGQSVAQVCQRLGAGPGLEFSAGLSNYPVYADAQCGHGPFVSKPSERDMDCPGSLDDTEATCHGLGPRWNLRAAYQKNNRIAAESEAVTEQADADVESVVDDVAAAMFTDETVKMTVDDTVGPSVGTPVAVADLPIDTDTETENPAENPVELVEADQGSRTSSDVFEGRTITIEGQRYLQASDDVAAIGGAIGTRIIVDGLVFIKDDGFVNPEHLYRAGTDVAKNDTESDRQTEAEPDEILAQKVITSDDPATKLPSDQPEPSLGAAQHQGIEPNFEVQSGQVIEVEEQIQEEGVAQESLSTKPDSMVAADKVGLRDSSENVKSGMDSGQQSLMVDVPAESTINEALRKLRLADLKVYWELEAAQAGNESKLAVHEEDNGGSAALPAEQALDEAARQVKPLQTVDRETERRGDPLFPEGTLPGQTMINAMRLPAGARADTRNFRYLEAMPVSFDVGGNGLLLEGSGQSHQRFQYFGQLGLASTYQRLMLGAGYFLTPASASRLTVILLAGLEHGDFELADETRAPGRTFSLTDTGVHVATATRLVISRRFELKAGVGYSSYFEGDTMVFGGGRYQITPRLDISSRFEIGDNDLLGIGIRYYY